MPGPLAAKVRAKYPGVYDDLDDAALEAQVLAKYPDYADIAKPSAEPKAPNNAGRIGAGIFGGSMNISDLPEDIRAQLMNPPSAKGDALLQNVKNIARTGVQALPAAGGMAGGMLGAVGGPPGAIAGAALGGAAGEAGRQLINRATGQSAPDTPGAAARQIAGQGALNAAGQGVGEVAGAVASKAAPWLMNRALNLTDKLSREFPDLSTTMIERALSVSKTGLGHARTLLREAKGEANAALQTADAAGARVPVTAATDGLKRTLKAVMDGPDIEGGLATLASVERAISKGRQAALSPIEADALKKSLQTQSKALYTAQKMGQGKPNVTVKAQALADMAASLNQSIGDVTTAAGASGYRAANAEAAKMIGAVRGIEKGTRAGSNLYQAMVRPGVGAVTGGLLGAQSNGTKGAVTGALVGGALTSPAGMSRLAIALSKPGVQVILRGSPKLAAAVASFLAGEEMDEEP